MDGVERLAFSLRTGQTTSTSGRSSACGNFRSSRLADTRLHEGVLPLDNYDYLEKMGAYTRPRSLYPTPFLSRPPDSHLTGS